jgi:CubicO group peptidase (beta-lactamase class C family)
MSALSQGTVAPGYEIVRDAFDLHLRDGIEDCVQCCAYVGGICVVDLWGSTKLPGSTVKEEESYGPSSIQNIFSSTKCLTSLVIAMLADRKRLRYDQLVTDLWPEYAAHGKGDTTISMVMRHEAGLSAFDQDLPASDLVAARLREGSVSDVIAGQAPSHPPGQERTYHAVTRGWIVNEIVRRADEHGRTIGQFLHDEVAVPLGVEGELVVGVPHEMQHRIAPLNASLAADLWFTWRQLLLPRLLGGGKVPLQSKVLRGIIIAGIPLFKSGLIGLAMGIHQRVRPSRDPPRNAGGLAVGVGLSDITEADGDRLRALGSQEELTAALRNMNPARLFNLSAVRAAEMPSANGHASARALAKVAAAIAGGGAVGGATGVSGGGGEPTARTRIMTEHGTAEAQAGEVKRRLFGVMDTWFGNAGWNSFKQARHGYVGWMGLGGSVLQWHPEMDIGFGYAMNLLEATPSNERARVLQSAVKECAKRQRQQQQQHKSRAARL